MMNFGKAVLGLGLVAVASASFARMPKNSYLVRPAKNMAELVAQVKSEPVVMDRYKRHFSMTDNEVVEYISSLRLGRTQRSGVYTVFGVPSNGKIHVNNQSIRKGTLVWFDAAGMPALLEICGNPMGLGPKRMTMANLVAPAAATVPANDIVAMSTMPTDPVVTAPVMTEMMPATPVTPPPIDVAPTFVSRSSNLLPLIVPAALVAASIDNGGKEPVPEPATMTALATGAAALAARKRRAKK